MLLVVWGLLQFDAPSRYMLLLQYKEEFHCSLSVSSSLTGVALKSLFSVTLFMQSVTVFSSLLRLFQKANLNTTCKMFRTIFQCSVQNCDLPTPMYYKASL